MQLKKYIYSVLSLPPGLSLPVDPFTELGAKLSHSLGSGLWKVCVEGGNNQKEKTCWRSIPPLNCPPCAMRAKGKKTRAKRKKRRCPAVPLFIILLFLFLLSVTVRLQPVSHRAHFSIARLGLIALGEKKTQLLLAAAAAPSTTTTSTHPKFTLFRAMHSKCCSGPSPDASPHSHPHAHIQAP